MALHIETPLIESQPLRERLGKQIFLKMEALQPSGSFKNRGIGLACETLAKKGAKRFVSSSGGNAGLAVAYSGRKLSIPVLVVVPETTGERAKQLIRLEGAEIIVKGASWQEANAFALSTMRAGDEFIHPFDHPLLWDGHASLIDEVVAQRVAFDAVALSVGGGGLYAGIAEGLMRNGLASIPIVAVETEGAASFHKSLQERKRIELDAITTKALTLGAKQVCERAFSLGLKHPTLSITVSDAEALAACRNFLDDHRVLVELACGATLAPLYLNHRVIHDFHKILVVVCGGAGVTHQTIYPE